jgi:hypothetical protein
MKQANFWPTLSQPLEVPEVSRIDHDLCDVWVASWPNDIIVTHSTVSYLISVFMKPEQDYPTLNTFIDDTYTV